MPTPRTDLLVSLVTFNARLWLGGLASALFVPLSLLAGLLDWIGGRGPHDGLFARVRRDAGHVDAWIASVDGARVSRGPDDRGPGYSPGDAREPAPAGRTSTSA